MGCNQCIFWGETGGDRSTVEFSPVYGTDAEFKSDISYLKSKGKKIVLSIGGQNGVVYFLTMPLRIVLLIPYNLWSINTVLTE